MYRIFCDHQTTRRQRLHFVCNENDTVMFSGKDLGACLEWLAEQGALAAELIAPKSRWQIAFDKVPAGAGHLDDPRPHG